MGRGRSGWLAVAVLGGLMAGCDDPPAEQENMAHKTAMPQEKPSATDWLAVDDTRSPAQWLAERDAGKPVRKDDPRVVALQERLDAAVARYHETRRMLANRAAQLTEVARENGDSLTAATILAELTFPSTDSSKLWFGVLTQAYIVLRQGGDSHAEAVARLREQYGR